jgi:membrane fusion protein, heavy metal efflux system
MRTSILIAIPIVISAFLTGCGKKEEIAEKKDPFCITDTVMRQMKLDTVAEREVENELNLTGKVTFNEDKVVNVYPLAGGHVESLKVELGDYVKKGQVLATIRSSEIAEFENQMISAESNLSIAKKNMEVAEDMFKSGLNSEKDVVTARLDLQKAKSELSRIREVMKIYGVQNQPIYSVKAPISGFIVKKDISENMELRTDNPQQLFTISDLDNVWVMANVYESDIAKLQTGYEVSIKTISYPDKTFTGKIDKIFNVIDPETKVLKVRIVLSNKDYLLKPEMFANITVKFAGNRKMASLPEDGVIFDKNKNFVMVYNDKCNVETREVKVYDTIEGYSYIENGLKDGDVIISKYQLLVYDALND